MHLMQYIFSGKQFDVTVMPHSGFSKFFCKSRNDVRAKLFSDRTGEDYRDLF